MVQFNYICLHNRRIYEKSLNSWFVIIIIIAGIYVGIQINKTGIKFVSNEAQETTDPYKSYEVMRNILRKKIL
jgi:hypothetical protein